LNVRDDGKERFSSLVTKLCLNYFKYKRFTRKEFLQTRKWTVTYFFISKPLPAPV